jgi:hypothetical protein
MYLLELESGNLSIEYQPEEQAIIKWGMNRIGPSFRTAGLDIDVVHVDGVRLINGYGWGQPCLISADRRGRRVLLQLFALIQEVVASDSVMV